MKDTTALKLIAELNIAIEKLEAGKGAKEVIASLENAIQGIMDTMEVEGLSWFDSAQMICHGRVL